MSSLLLVMLVAVANLALGAGVAIATDAAPPLREIIDGIIYERYDDSGNEVGGNEVDAATDATKAAGDDPGESD
jgi:hypothetical protein